MNKNEGGLHTQGEWQLSKSGEVIYCGVISVATTHEHSNSKANAELIVKAVNAYNNQEPFEQQVDKWLSDLEAAEKKNEKLLASNRELVEICTKIFDDINSGKIDAKNGIVKDSYVWHKLETAINNSKY